MNNLALKNAGLVVKEVNFFGDTLMVSKDSEGILWAGVKWFCDGLGLSEGQIKAERKKIQEDLVLSKGGRNLMLPTNGGNQEALCLQLDYVPLWLAKISITPNMRENNPELVGKLVKYQLKAKDALAQAFLPQIKPVRRIGKNKTKIALYAGEHSYILMIGEELYDLEINEFNELNSLIPEMAFMEVSQIARVVRAYLSVHEDSSPKLRKQWDMDCEG